MYFQCILEDLTPQGKTHIKSSVVTGPDHKVAVKLLRVYTKWSLVLKHICAGGGNVTFVVLRTFGAR